MKGTSFWRICEWWHVSRDGFKASSFLFSYPWYGFQEPFGIWVQGRGEEVHNLRLFYDHATVHDYDPLAYL